MSEKTNKCAFCNLVADRFCPIAGKEICSTTCLEISLWAEEIQDAGDEVYLEFIDHIRINCRQELSISDDKRIAVKCCSCLYHWVDS